MISSTRMLTAGDLNEDISLQGEAEGPDATCLPVDGHSRHWPIGALPGEVLSPASSTATLAISPSTSKWVDQLSEKKEQREQTRTSFKPTWSDTRTLTSGSYGPGSTLKSRIGDRFTFDSNGITIETVTFPSNGVCIDVALSNNEKNSYLAPSRVDLARLFKPNRKRQAASSSWVERVFGRKDDDFLHTDDGTSERRDIVRKGKIATPLGTVEIYKNSSHGTGGSAFSHLKFHRGMRVQMCNNSATNTAGDAFCNIEFR